MKAFYELLRADTYYRNKAPGWVLLRNGHVVIHGTKAQCNSIRRTA